MVAEVGPVRTLSPIGGCAVVAEVGWETAAASGCEEDGGELARVVGADAGAGAVGSEASNALGALAPFQHWVAELAGRLEAIEERI